MLELEAVWEEFRVISPLIDPYRVYRVPDHMRQRGVIFAFEGQATVEGRTVLLQVGLDQRFPRSLPLIFIMPWNALGLIPHVDDAGKVCYAQTEGLLLDRSAPATIAVEAVERSLKTLGAGVRGENRHDFVEEFESYWACLESVQVVPAVIESSAMVQNITSVVDPEGDNNVPICLTTDPGTMKSYLDLDPSRNYVHRCALYVPFEEGTFLKPPPYDRFWSLSEMQDIVWVGLSRENYRRLLRLGKKQKTAHSVVFSLPRPSGKSALFGIHFGDVESYSPLVPGGSARSSSPFLLDRRDKEYLMPRGGANLVLRSKRVAILGCGSVGGFLALELARAGIQNLALVDPERLRPDNTFRHVLGLSSWHRSKSLALKDEIASKLPYTRVEAFKARAEDAIEHGDITLRDYDLVISAIGDDTTNLHLNQLLRSESDGPPVIFTWLEPYGIGGHALLTGRSRGRGCLECLFTPVPEERDCLLHNRAAFAAAGQFFGSTVSGCSTLFTPYGSSHAVRTATLAVDLAIDTLLGSEPGNPVVSWKGCADEFQQAGYRLSRRYHLTEQQIYERRYGYMSPHCPVCGS